MNQNPAQTSRPVFLWAPAPRCGITLLQRLISSSKDVLVFGENRMLTGYMPAAVAKLQEPPEMRDASRKRLASGDFDFWSSDVHPIANAERQWCDSSFQMLASVYQYSATTEGFERWGVKEPMIDSSVLAVMRHYFPKANNVFIYRDLHDVLKSYKARGWIPTNAEIERYCSDWNAAMKDVLQGPEIPTLHVIRHEDLTTNREEECSKLEAFLNCSPFDRSVLDKRVNTFYGQEQKGHSPNEYIAPVNLSDEEWEFAKSIAGEAMELAGYEWHCED